MTKYVLKNVKKSKLIIVAMWVLYCASYFIRTCYAASIAPIVADGVYSKSEIGLVGTAFFICYGVGQLISGLIGDKINPFFMVFFGSVLGAGCCFLMPVAGSLGMLIAVWAVNGFFQSMLWSPILRVFSETIDESLSKKAILNIALSLPVGTVIAYIASSLVIKYFKWQYVFLLGGILVVIAVLFAGVSVLSSVKYIEKISVSNLPETEIKSENRKGGIIPLALASGLFIIMIPSFLHGMMRDGITNWVPAMISEVYGVSTSFSVFVTIALPIFNAFGAYLVTPLYKKLGENEMKTAGVTALVALVPLLLMLFMSKLPVYLTIVLLAVTTSVMYALNYLIISLVPVRFKNYGFTSGISGILNSGTHIGCALSSYGFGAIAEKTGWTAVIIVWIVSSLLITIFSFISNKKWSKFSSFQIVDK